MKVFKTRDNQIIKIVHDNKVETAVKSFSDCGTGENSRNKYSVFASCSYGCSMNCKFCMLTTKNIPYHSITTDSIIQNTKEGISKFIELNPSAREKKIKLSWMGMGEPLNHSKQIISASEVILDWTISNKLAKEIDSIDISTSLPKGMFSYKINKTIDILNYLTNSKIRVFVSIGSVVLENRKFLMNSNKYFQETSSTLRTILGINNLIFHIVFLEGINDSKEEIEKLIIFMKEIGRGAQLRVLRYNKCKNSPFEESSKFDKIKENLSLHLKNIKFQLSPGSEIMAACGQFLTKLN